MMKPPILAVGFFLSGMAVTGLAASCAMEMDTTSAGPDEEDPTLASTLDDEAVDDESAELTAFAAAAACPPGMSCQPVWPPLPPATLPDSDCSPEWITQYPKATAAEVLLMAALGATMINGRDLDYHPGAHDMWWRITRAAFGPIAQGGGIANTIRSEILRDPLGFVATNVAVPLGSNFPAWVNTLTADSPAELVLEKIGHVIERRWLPSTDAPGDEGAMFVFAIAQELNNSCDGGPDAIEQRMNDAKLQGDNWSELLHGTPGPGIGIQIWNPFKWAADFGSWLWREGREKFNKFVEFARNSPFLQCLGAAVAASTVCVTCAAAAVASTPEGGPAAWAAVGSVCGPFCLLIVTGATGVCIPD